MQVRSERDVVVGKIIGEIVGLGRCRLATRGRFLARRLTRRALAALPTTADLASPATTTATLAGTAAEHLHLVGNDVGGVALGAVLAGVLVVADRAFDVDLAALAQVFTSDLAELAEEGHPVP